MMYDMSSLTPNGACFFAKSLESVNWLWHKRISQLNFKNINRLAKQNKVLGLPSLVYLKDKPCPTCEEGKHHRASFKTKQNFSIKKCLHLLHMDLFGLVNPMSINHKKYTIVIVDVYSRVLSYHWREPLQLDVLALKANDISLLGKIGMLYYKLSLEVVVNPEAPDLYEIDLTPSVRESHASHYDQVVPKGKYPWKKSQAPEMIMSFITMNFSSAYTPEQNGVAERKNRTLIEAARTMLNGLVLSTAFNIIRQQVDETYHVTFDESMKDIRFTNTSVYEIGISDSFRYSLDEFLHENDPSRQYQANSDISYYVIPHGRSLTELTQEKHVLEVIGPNEPNSPHTEDAEGPPDLTNTEGTHE
nr:retrovirus-related Pol polyprotein from transposon TNT 1-94 [Tanacetum cinerariifolium]